MIELKEFSVLIIGCGIAGGGVAKTGASHAELVATHDGLTLVAAVDTVQARADQVVDWFGGAAYSHLSTALEETCPSLVIVSTPNDSHAAIVTEVLESAFKPRVLLVEKPICSDNEELRLLENLSNDSGVLLLTNHSKRMLPGTLKAKALIASGDLGEIVEMYGRYYGGWLHNGVHLVDLIQFISGESLATSKITGVLNGRVQDDPSIECVGRLKESRAPVSITALDEKNYQLFELDVMCKSGRIRIHEFGKEVDVFFRGENELGESILYSESTVGKVLEPVVVPHLMGVIYDYLDTSDTATIQELGLHMQEVKRTMKTIWATRKLLKPGKLHVR